MIFRITYFFVICVYGFFIICEDRFLLSRVIASLRYGGNIPGQQTKFKLGSLLQILSYLKTLTFLYWMNSSKISRPFLDLLLCVNCLLTWSCSLVKKGCFWKEQFCFCVFSVVVVKHI